MQYRGAKRIRRIAAAVLSAALLITELPQPGTVYAAQTQDTETSSVQTETAEGQNAQDESEESSQAEQAGEPQEETADTESSSAEMPAAGTSNTEPSSPEVPDTEPSDPEVPDTESSSTESSSTETPATEPSETESVNNTTEQETETETIADEETETTTDELPEQETETETETTEEQTESLEIKVPDVDTSVYTYSGESGRTSAYAQTRAVTYKSVAELKPEADGSYKIKSRDEFITFLSNPSAYASDVINLDCDIDMKGETALFNASFSGVFNGNGHSINNVKIQTGLFRSINRDAEVKNLHISNVVSDGVSGVVTAENSGTISYCVVTGNLTASDSVDKLAGIVGMNMGTVENCVFSGEITANDSYSGNVGAIVGLNSSGTVRNCYGIGKIAVSMGNVGGIAGRNDNVIENCANYMEVSSKAASGGISGENAGTVSGCDNYGAVTCRQSGTGQTGGIVAKNTASGKIENCYNHGSVSSSVNNVGGIAGTTAGTISKCGNYAGITGIANIGGIAGQNIGTKNTDGSAKSVITGCFNKGSVTGKEGTNAQGVGGILGSSEYKSDSVPYAVSIENCYNTGSITPDTTVGYAGGIVGILKCGAVSNAYNTANILNVTCSGMIAGFLGEAGVADCANVYYLEGGIERIACRADEIVVDASAKKTEQELKELAGTLGGGFESDGGSVNGGYPIVAGQGAEQRSYPVVYELNGGCLDKYFHLVRSGDSVGAAPADPVRKHADFKGWFSDAACTSAYGFTAPVDKPTMVYAKWDTYVAVERIEAAMKNITLQIEEEQKIAVSIYPENAENAALIWKSENTSIADVGQDGTVKAVGTGTTYVTVSVADDETISARIQVNVTADEIFVRRVDTNELISAPTTGISSGFAVNDEIVVEVKYGKGISANRKIQWTTSNAKVFKFKELEPADRDRVTLVGVGTGTAKLTIVISEGDKYYEAVICNIAVAPQASSITIKMGNEEASGNITYDLYTKKFIAAGNKKLDKPTDELTAEILPRDAGQKVEWKSSRESVIRFPDSKSGVAVGNGEGEAVITAAALDGSKVTQSATVYTRRIVQSFTMAAESVNKNIPVVKEGDEIVITSGNGVKLTPEFVPASVSNMSLSFSVTSGDKNAIKFSSNNPDGKPDIKTVMTITANKVTANTRVTVKAVSLDAGKAECEIKLVIKPLTESVNLYKNTDLQHHVNGSTIGINPEKDDMFFTLTAKNYPDNASQAVTWKTSNPKIAKVEKTSDRTCKVNVLDKGNAIITATAADGSGVTATVTVNVSALASDIVITGSNMVMKGSTIRLKAEVYPKSATNQKVKWSSLMDSIAKVNPTTGDVTGVAPGTAVIIAEAADGSGVQATHTVRVTDVITKFDIVSLDSSLSEKDAVLSGKSVGLDPDKNMLTYKLGVKILPDTACQTVTWKSSNEKVVKVEDGLITAVGMGTANVTATSTDGSKNTASVKVFVTTLVKSIKISGSHYVGMDKSVQLKVEVGGKDAANKSVLWRSNNPENIQVDGNGMVTALNRFGMAEITAEAADGSGVKDRFMVYAVAYPDKVDIASYDRLLSIEENESTKKKSAEVDMRNGDTYRLEAIFNDNNSTSQGEAGYPKTVTWSTSDKTIAVVEPDPASDGRIAQVTVLRKGSVTITAKTTDGTGVTDTCRLNIKDPEPKVKITGPTQVAMGKKIQLSAGYTSVEWKLANPGDASIATVNSKGQVTAKKQEGDVEIVAVAKDGNNGEKDSHIVHVRPAVSEVTILVNGIPQKNKATLGVDILSDPLQLTAIVVGDDNTNVKWSSNKTSIATVDENGVVEVKKNGKAVITAAAIDGSGKKATLTINVSKKVTAVTPDGADEVKVGLKKTVQLSVKYSPMSATTKKVVWESEAPSVVSVNKTTGKVTAKKMIDLFQYPNGYITVKATPADNGNGEPCYFRVYVTNPVNKVEILEKGSTEYNAVLGVDLSTTPAEKQLIFRLTDNKKPANELTDQSVAWKSSNTKVAKVDENGLVTGLSTGKVTITATACDGSKKSGKVTLYVGKLITSFKIMDVEDKSKELTEIKLRKGNSYTLLPEQIKILPITASNQKLTYTTSDKKIATVTSNGKITAKKSGEEAWITITTTDGSNLSWKIRILTL
ncbi:MAG: Ig-like domain-containing protein [Lachnospiraceae bacterium]|nr:Ig-like domain-containing protein [Lachnospiraceae bacterium]